MDLLILRWTDEHGILLLTSKGAAFRAHHEERSFITTETAARIAIVASGMPMKSFTEILALVRSMRTTFSATGLA